MFSKKPSFNPADAADSTVGSSIDDVLWTCKNVGPASEEFDEADLISAWANYMKIFCALTIQTVGKKLPQKDATAFIHEYIPAMLHRIDIAEGVEGIREALNTDDWYDDVDMLVKMPNDEVAEQAYKDLSENLPFELNSTNQYDLTGYLSNRVPLIKKQLSGYNYKLGT